MQYSVLESPVIVPSCDKIDLPQLFRLSSHLKLILLKNLTNSCTVRLFSIRLQLTINDVRTEKAHTSRKRHFFWVFCDQIYTEQTHGNIEIYLVSM